MASVCRPEVCLNLLSMTFGSYAPDSHVKLPKSDKLQEAKARQNAMCRWRCVVVEVHMESRVRIHRPGLQLLPLGGQKL